MLWWALQMFRLDVFRMLCFKQDSAFPTQRFSRVCSKARTVLVQQSSSLKYIYSFPLYVYNAVSDSASYRSKKHWLCATLVTGILTVAPHPFGPRVFICSGKIKCNCHKNTKTFLHFVNLFIFSSSRKRKHKDAEMIRGPVGTVGSSGWEVQGWGGICSCGSWAKERKSKVNKKLMLF